MKTEVSKLKLDLMRNITTLGYQNASKQKTSLAAQIIENSAATLVNRVIPDLDEEAVNALSNLFFGFDGEIT